MLNVRRCQPDDMSRWWLVVIALLAVLVRKLIIWLGYSWVTGTAVAVVMIFGFFVFLDRRLPKR